MESVFCLNGPCSALTDQKAWSLLCAVRSALVLDTIHNSRFLYDSGLPRGVVDPRGHWAND